MTQDAPGYSDVVLQQLRALTAACRSRYQFDGAAWYANKAVTLSAAAPRDVYAFADALFCGGDTARALRTLEIFRFLDPAAFLNARHPAAVAAAAEGNHHRWEGSASRVEAQWLPFFYLTALCLKRLKAWERWAYTCS